MELATALGFLVGSLVVGLVSGLVPVFNTEAYLLAVAAFAPSDRLLPVVVLTTLGQMIAKSLLYLAGSGVVSPRFLGARAARLEAGEDPSRESAGRSRRRRLRERRGRVAALLPGEPRRGIAPLSPSRASCSWAAAAGCFASPRSSPCPASWG